MPFTGNIPSSQLTPGFALSILLVSGDNSPGSAPLRALLIASLSASGTMLADTEVKTGVAGPDAVKGFIGPGSPGHLTAKALFAECPLASVDLVAPAEAAGVAATATIIFDATTPVTVPQTLTITIAGREIVFVWGIGVSAIAAATGLVAKVVGYDADLPTTPSNVGGTSATFSLTAKQKGTWGNDIQVTAVLSDGTGGAITLSGPKLTGGTTEMDIATVLTLTATTQYDLIVLATSNADAASTSSSSNPAKLKSYIVTNYTGMTALLQQGIYAHTGTTSAAKAGIASIDLPQMQVVYSRNVRSLPCEWAGAEAGARLREEAIDPNVNRTNRSDMPYRARLYASKTQSTDALKTIEEEDMLQSGASSVRYTAIGEPFVCIPRTTYFKDAAGLIDHRAIYVSQVSSMHWLGNGLRSYLPVRFRGSKIVKVLPKNREQLPAYVVDVGLVNDVTIAWIRREGVPRGIVDEAALDAAIKAGEILCGLDAGNSSKVNFTAPISIVPPLTIFDYTLMQRKAG
jgi:phage tail sheath gpL-like